jgi:polyphenol oxidase
MSLAQRFAAAGLDWLLPTWRVPSNVHGFVTTRNGGPRADESVALDLGPAHLSALDAAARDAIVANRARAGAFLPSPPVWLEQVHGTAVASIGAHNVDVARSHPPVADAVLTRLPDVPLAVRVADCLPVLFADDAGTVVAVAHAGWRGLAAGVLEATVAAMPVKPASLVAWIGPAIGPRAFEVGDDVRDAFAGHDRGSLMHFVRARDGKWIADLPALARRRLAAVNVTRVTGGDQCTWSDASRFFSYRRDRTSARMAAFVWRTGAVASR